MVRPLCRYGISARTGKPLPLTDRHFDTLERLPEGDRPEEIAARLGVEVESVNQYVAQIRIRMGAKTTAHAVALAYQRGLLDIPPASLRSNRRRQQPTPQNEEQPE